MSSMSSDSNAVKPKKQVGWMWRTEPSVLGVVRLTIDAKTDYYFVREIQCDYGISIEVNKLVEGEGIVSTYNVNLQDNTSSCDCPGFTYHSTCRHVDFLTALRTAGRL